MVFASLMCEPLGAGNCADAWGQRIAGIICVHDTAALHAFAGTPAAFGVIFTVEIAVSLGVGIDDAADGSVLAGDFGLDAAPAFAVARNHDRAFDGNAEPVELFVVVAVAVIHIYERSGYVAVN